MEAQIENKHFLKPFLDALDHLENLKNNCNFLLFLSSYYLQGHSKPSLDVKDRDW